MISVQKCMFDDKRKVLKIISDWYNTVCDADVMNLQHMSLLINWNWHISFRDSAEMHPEAPQLFVKKANASLSHDVNDTDRDIPHLFKLPSYSWNIQTVWQHLIQLEWLSTPHKAE